MKSGKVSSIGGISIQACGHELCGASLSGSPEFDWEKKTMLSAGRNRKSFCYTQKVKNICKDVTRSICPHTRVITSRLKDSQCTQSRQEALIPEQFSRNRQCFRLEPNVSTRLGFYVISITLCLRFVITKKHSTALANGAWWALLEEGTVGTWRIVKEQMGTWGGGLQTP